MAISSREFYLGDTVLAVFEDAYLVKVVTHQSFSFRNSLMELPDWIFTSKNAIWLMEEQAPLQVRANHGEAIRKRLNDELQTSNKRSCGNIG